MVLHVLHFLLQWGHVDGECGEGGWEGDRWELSHFELYQCEPEEPTCGRGRGREGKGGGKGRRGRRGEGGEGIIFCCDDAPHNGRLVT